MSDTKRATLITVGAPKSAKNNVTKTVRLSLNLVESNESKYPELNYKELVITEERKKRVENGKIAGLDPYSDNDDDVERVARKFEQKYGGRSTYGRKGRSKKDDYADIGAGYDENDSFIDNTHGYDEMIPPECDTFYGGFYINSGSLEFKTVRDNQTAISDGEPTGSKRNKRRISSSSEYSESSSESESQDEKDSKTITNGAVDSHKTEHRKKKKNKNIDKKNPKKIRRTDSSAATSGKQTSDDNIQGEAESADSKTSQSDSLMSKPAPSSENAITSDSSRDVEAKTEINLPTPVLQVLEEIEATDLKQLKDSPAEFQAKSDEFILKLERSLNKCKPINRIRRLAWTRISKLLGKSKCNLVQRLKTLTKSNTDSTSNTPSGSTMNIAQNTTAHSTTAAVSGVNNNKRKWIDDEKKIDISRFTAEEKEAKIVETLQKLKELIDERKPGMMANYNAECERVQEERKKIMSATDGGPHIEKRLPKRRFPWCPRSRALLAQLKNLAGDQEAATTLLAKRALPLFPSGFVRMPTLLRQADLSKELKPPDMKQPRLGLSHQTAGTQSTNVQASQPQPQTFAEPIQFPSSLTVTTTLKKSPERIETNFKEDKVKTSTTSVFVSLKKDIAEKTEERKKESVTVDKVKEDVFIPHTNIGSSITITPVVSNQTKVEKKIVSNSVTITADVSKNVDKKVNNSVTITAEKQKEPLLRVKSPAALNEMYKKDKEKQNKKVDKNQSNVSNIKEKRVESPLHIDTSFQPNKIEPRSSPNQSKVEEISQKQIENMRVVENNIPRPALVPVHHSPTFAKPDKRPPEVKKKKDILIISDVDPLSDIQQEAVSIDDSSSDVEVIEENIKIDNGEAKPCDKGEKSDSVPSKDKVCVRDETNHKKPTVNSAKHVSKNRVMNKDVRNQENQRKNDKLDEATKEDIDTVMRNLREMEHSQETTKFNSNSFGGVITSAQNELL